MLPRALGVPARAAAAACLTATVRRRVVMQPRRALAASSGGGGGRQPAAGGDGAAEPAPGHGTAAGEASPAPFRGRYVVEGTLLPMEETDPGAAESHGSIEDRLQHRLQAKDSSTRLSTEAGGHEGMFRAAPADLAPAHRSEEYRVTDGNEHLEAFQSVFRRLRRTGRNPEDDRDVSDSMLKVLEYVQRKKSAAGGGGGGQE
mmetsp:Transcript_88530/g.274081  ORF Transcript_88530/g.274081 Transcript_88530/m.274081 type:complete len:202 (-) Transcript_88530:24-629(-)